MRIFLLLFFLPLFTGCDSQQRENSLRLKGDSLLKKEADLAILEKNLLLKEEDLEARKHLLDSVQQEDTNYIIDPKLTGAWDVRMTCSETNCPGSAVGDTKAETWRFSFQGKRLSVVSLVRNQVSRFYTGKYTSEGIYLKGDIESEAEVATNTKIEVQLQVKDTNTIEGVRRIIREGDCTITYSIKLNRS